MAERIFVLGGTGNIGAQVVKRLIEANVPATVFSRDQQKAQNNFGDALSSGKVKFVKGDYSDEAVFADSIKGHSRLFLLVHGLGHMGAIKHNLGKIAFEAGVKQIVDISSYTCSMLRDGIISSAHIDGEESLRALVKQNPESRSCVFLRGGFFMTNHLMAEVHTIKGGNFITSTAKPSSKRSLIDPLDIGDIAANVLLEPIEKHSNSVYPLHPESLSNEERAAVFSKVLGRKIIYKQNEDFQAQYDQFLKHGMDHKMAYNFVMPLEYDNPSPQISVLLKKPFRTFEQWVETNKAAF